MCDELAAAGGDRRKHFERRSPPAGEKQDKVVLLLKNHNIVISLSILQRLLPPLSRSLLGGLLLLCLSLTAMGHAKLVRSQPQPKETLPSPPKLIELWFTEELEPRLNTIEVKDSSGNRVDRGEVVLAEENKKAQVELGDLTPGIYSVEWKVLSADQHAIRGSFIFTWPLRRSRLELSPSNLPLYIAWSTK